MGASKFSSFTTEQNELSTLFKALAHPARIAIIEYLIKVESCICGDIVNQIPLAQPTISQHLKELKNANVITGNVEGTSICYCLNPDTIKKFEKYFELISYKLKCC